MRRYEVSDHLGNVRTVINDRRTIFNPGNMSTQYYTATILNGTDYFPFGAEMRSSSAGGTGYRYGFNGKELDKSSEWGTLNHYDYGFRIYNPGIGKFLSVDPLTRSYPFLTPYQFAGNTPIQAIDLDGLEPDFVNSTTYEGETWGPTAQVSGKNESNSRSNNYSMLDRVKRAEIFANNNPLRRGIISRESSGLYGPIYDGRFEKVEVSSYGESEYKDGISKSYGVALLAGFGAAALPVAVETMLSGGAGGAQILRQTTPLLRAGWMRLKADFGWNLLDASFDVYKDVNISGKVQLDDVLLNFVIPGKNPYLKDFVKNGLGGIYNMELVHPETGGMTLSINKNNFNGLYGANLFKDAARTSILENTFGRFGGQYKRVYKNLFDYLLDYQTDKALDSYDRYYKN